MGLPLAFLFRIRSSSSAHRTTVRDLVAIYPQETIIGDRDRSSARARQKLHASVSQP